MMGVKNTGDTVSSLLYTVASDSVNEKVAEDLKVPDPEDTEAANAAIKDAECTSQKDTVKPKS